MFRKPTFTWIIRSLINEPVILFFLRFI